MPWDDPTSDPIADFNRAIEEAGPMTTHGNDAVTKYLILMFGQLPDGWDSYDSKAVDPRALKALEGVSFVPTPKGGWQFEWMHMGERLEFEIGPNGKMVSLTTEKDVSSETHTRTKTEPPGAGPDYCAECSADASDWVRWPCPTVKDA